MRTADFTRFGSRLYLSGTLTLTTALRIGAGDVDNIASADIAVVKDATGRPYIPGSSFKGVLRSYLEGLMRAINPSPSFACECVTPRKGNNEGCPTTRDGRAWEELREKLMEEGTPFDEFVLTESCHVCQVFGSPWLSSKVLVSDLPVAGEWLGRYQVRDGVAIDRDTGTAGEGLLYSFEAVPTGTEFRCEILIENASNAEQGMVLLGLRAFEQGLGRLGGATSRGLGRVQLAWNWPECYELHAEKPGRLLDFLLTGRGDPFDEKAAQEKMVAFRKEIGV